MAISQRIRFEVFKRDGFICQYCGKTPPNIILELDHINPVSKGGTDDINNLITSCFECNRGKNNIPLDRIPQTLHNNLEILKEKELQIKEYNKILEKIERRTQKEMTEIGAVYTGFFPKWILSENFTNNSLKRFFQYLPKKEMIDAMSYACSRIKDKDKSINYFCGICWNKIKAKIDPNYNTEQEIRKYWQYQPKGSHYLDDRKIKEWLNKYSIEEIKIAMDKARGYWNLLKEELDGAN